MNTCMYTFTSKIFSNDGNVDSARKHISLDGCKFCKLSNKLETFLCITSLSQDSADPYSVDNSLGASQFGAVMMSQDPTSFDPEVLEAVRDKQRADGFIFQVRINNKHDLEYISALRETFPMVFLRIYLIYFK